MASGEEGKGETVMVTGASGFIGSTLVRRFLDRGYNVHAGVLNPDDRAETDHLLALAAGAGEARLRIFRCDLFDGAALLDAARGCSGVFHLASPCIVDAVSDPQRQLIVPAVEGTLNVLRAAMDAGGVRRVVVTSSNSAIIPSPEWPAGEVRDERFWTDIDYCEKNGVSACHTGERFLGVALVLCLEDTGREGGVEVCGREGARCGCGEPGDCHGPDNSTNHQFQHVRPSTPPSRLHRGVHGYLHGSSPRGRRCAGSYPGVREPISVREAPLHPIHLSLERLRGQSRRALPQLQSAQVPKGYPAWAGEGRSRIEEAHRAGVADQPPGEDNQRCCGEPQDQRVHLVIDRGDTAMQQWSRRPLDLTQFVIIDSVD